MKSVSGKEFAAILRRHGWELRRINGSHHVFAKPSRPAHISLPIHGNETLKLGLLRHLMKLADLTESDL